MKILAIGDLHGRKPKIHFRDFDCIIQVGDVCDDREIKPYIKKWFVTIKKDEVNTPSDSDKFIEKMIGLKGLRKIEKNSLEVGRKIMEYLNGFGKPVFFVPGNWDQSYGKTKIKSLDNDFNSRKYFYDAYLGKKVNPKLVKGLKNIIDCQYKNNFCCGINFIGYGLSSGPEFLKNKGRKLKLTKKQFLVLKMDLSKIFANLYSAYSKRDKRYSTIFLTHDIPYETKLDTVNDKKSYAYKKHLGSQVARKFCEKYQPLICIGGHMHEGAGKDKIGKTVVINPGYGVDAQVLIDIDETKGKIRSIKFLGNAKKHHH